MRKTIQPDSKIPAFSVHDLLDHLPVRVYVKDASLKFRYVNYKCANDLGIDSPREAYGLDDLHFYDSPSVSQWRRDEEKILSGELESFSEIEKEKHVNFSARWVLTSKFPLKGSDDSIVGICGVTADVSNSLQVLELYKLAAESTGEGLWFRELREPWRVWYSPRWKQMLGYTDHELANQKSTFLDLVDPLDVDKVKSAIDSAVQSNAEAYSMRFKMIDKSGDRRLIESKGQITRSGDGSAIHIAGCHTDITETVGTEQFYQRILDEIPGFVFAKDGAGRFRLVNKGICEAIGLSKEEIIGKSDADINRNKTQVRKFQEDDRKVIYLGESLDIEAEGFTTHGGRVLTLATRKVPFNDQGPTRQSSIRLLGVSTDISPLVAEQNRLLSVIDNLPDGVFFKTLENKFSRVNASLLSMFGLDNESQIVRHHVKDFLNDEQLKTSLEEDAQIIETQCTIENRMSSHVVGDEKKHFLVSKMPLAGKDGRVEQIVGIVKDVTELKNTESELLSHREVLESTFDTLPQAISVTDRGGTIIECNEGFIRKHNQTSKSNVVGQPHYAFYPKLEADKFSLIDAQVMANDFPQYATREKRSIQEKSKPCVTSRLPLHGEDGNVTGLVSIVDVIEDIHSHEAAKELWLEEISEHITTCTLSWVERLDELVFQAARNPGNAAEHLRRIQKLSKYIRHSLRNAAAIRGLAGDIELDDCNLVECANDVISVLSLPDSFNPEFPANPQDAVVEAPQLHLKGVILELLSNATFFAVAAESGGNIGLSIEIRDDEIDLVVRDYGPGISQEIEDKIFEPFFTTAAYQRLGLGLNFVRKVLDSLGGNVTHNQEYRSGAEFIVTFRRKKL